MSKRIIEDVYVVSAKRTPVAKGKRGSFAKVRPDDLMTHAMKGALEGVDIDPNCIDDVIVGCAMPEAEQGLNVARLCALMTGLPQSVSGMTINRYCSSGLQSIAIAADRIALGACDAMIAGGTESMSMIPMGGHNISANKKFFDNDEALVGAAYGMGLTAECVADAYKIDRQAQDAFAYQSHMRAIKAADSGAFKDEILPFEVAMPKPDLKTGSIKHDSINVSFDEGPRSDTSLEALAKLKPVFKNKGSVTAGNSSQVSDGAGAVLLVNEKTLKRFNLNPLARFCGYSVAGVDPKVMGIGPVEAIPKCLSYCGLKQEDLDWIELNEAFSAQSLAVIETLKLDQEKVNPLGGAIALGHPLGATGAIRTSTLLHGLKRQQLRYGMVTMCIGAGMGAAGIFENLS